MTIRELVEQLVIAAAKVGDDARVGVTICEVGSHYENAIMDVMVNVEPPEVAEGWGLDALVMVQASDICEDTWEATGKRISE